VVPYAAKFSVRLTYFGSGLDLRFALMQWVDLHYFDGIDATPPQKKQSNGCFCISMNNGKFNYIQLYVTCIYMCLITSNVCREQKIHLELY
jgi:hypothetical protein